VGGGDAAKQQMRIDECNSQRAPSRSFSWSMAATKRGRRRNSNL